MKKSELSQRYLSLYSAEKPIWKTNVRRWLAMKVSFLNNADSQQR